MKGKTWFRVNPVNIYTEKKHINGLFETLKEYCDIEIGSHTPVTS
jgi:hypothetical protein